MRFGSEISGISGISQHFQPVFLDWRTYTDDTEKIIRNDS